MMTGKITKAKKMMMAGPERTAISKRAAHPIPRRRRPTPDGGSTAVVLPPSDRRFTGGPFGTDELSRVETDMCVALLCLRSGIVGRLDDARGVSRSGQHVHHAGVESVADVLTVNGVQPLGHVWGTVVRDQDVLEVGLGHDALSRGVHRRSVEGLVVRLLDGRGRDVVQEVGASRLRGLGGARVAVDTTHDRGRV